MPAGPKFIEVPHHRGQHQADALAAQQAVDGGCRLPDLVGLWVDQAFALTREPALAQAARSTLTAVEEQQHRDQRGFRQHERCSRLVASV